MITQTLKLETPEQFRSALRIQALDKQASLLNQQMEQLQDQMRTLQGQMQRILLAERAEVKETFGLENATPIRVADEGLVVHVEAEKSPGKPGKSIPSGNGSHRGTKKGSRFTSGGNTRPTGTTNGSSD